MTRALAAVLVVAASCGCAPIVSPVDVEALVRDPRETGEFHLDTVTLESVTDLMRGAGERFDVRAGMTVGVLEVLERLGDEELSFDEVVAASRTDVGDDVQPRLAFDGARYLAEDFDSLLYLTLLYNFERAWSFAEQLGDESSATTSKSLVGFYGTIALAEALPVPVQTADNAAYVSFADAWLTFRIFLAGEGVPFAMNDGVIAHELHHRVFFRNVFDGDAYDNWRAFVTGDEVSRGGQLMRALDEGLADLFAVGHTRDTAFMAPSLKGVFADEAGFRDLEGGLADAVTYDDLSQSYLPDVEQRHCGFAREAGEDLYALPQFNIYCGGTLAARALWEGAGRDFDVLRNDVLPAVNRALPEVGRRIAAASGSRELVFDLDMFLDAFVAELPVERAGEMCAALAVRYESLFSEGRVPACD